MRLARVLTVTAIAASGVLVVGGLAMAAIPDAQGVIHGCYAKSGGQLKVIDTAKGEKCPTGYTPLDWNKQGIAGTNGIDGEDGEDGAPGKDGINGIDGIDGTNGTNGEDGAPGKDGTNGTNGTNGTDGETGATGPSDAYTTPDGQAGTILGSGVTVVKTLSLPAGQYTASATATATLFQVESQNDTLASCALTVDPIAGAPVLVRGQANSSIRPNEFGGQYESLATQAAFQTGADGTTLKFQCLGTNAGINNINLAAIRVGSLHVG